MNVRTQPGPAAGAAVRDGGAAAIGHPGAGAPGARAGLVSALAAFAARADRSARPATTDTDAAARAGASGGGPSGGRPECVVLADRDDATVVRVGAAVAKAHARGTDAGALGVRLGVAAHPSLRAVLLPPYGAGPGTAGGRPVTVWPYGEPVDPQQPAAAPWEAAATLLARLHAVPPDALPGPLPPMRGPAKAAAAMARLHAAPGSAAARTVRRAWRRLPARARDEAPYEGRSALCHGDWHLGQLVRHRAAPDGWLLIDVDDLGLGDPAWDLARPAMWFGAGLLSPEEWARFLGAYRAAGGQAVPAGDPWERLDVPARALAVQSAAIAVAKAARDGRELDEAESALVAACARIAQLE